MRSGLWQSDIGWMCKIGLRCISSAMAAVAILSQICSPSCSVRLSSAVIRLLGVVGAEFARVPAGCGFAGVVLAGRGSARALGVLCLLQVRDLSSMSRGVGCSE
jgi:hypothetical protein